MNSINISFTGLPPIDVPFRYFISAPLFIIAIALIMLFSGNSWWLSRWQNETLAITHAFTLGFISTIMMGALYQLLPVTAGLSFPKSRLIATICHSLHVAGSTLLITGFLIADHRIQLSAALFLGSSFFTYISVIVYILMKNHGINSKLQHKIELRNNNKQHQNFTLQGIKAAILSITITVILGLLLQTNFMGFQVFNLGHNFVNLHAIWGLIGWIGILIIAISFQVVPMFYVAPSFPLWLKRFSPITILVALLLLALLYFYPQLQLIHQLIQIGLLIINCTFAFYLLKTITHRKRKIADTTVYYWQLAAILFLIISVITVTPENLLPVNVIQKKVLLLSALFIFGYVVSLIQSMLLKIVPFLVFTHLQQRCMINFSAMQALPKMHEILKKTHGQYLLACHCFSILTLIITILYPAWTWLFASSLLIEFLWLTFLIARCFYLYHYFNNKITRLLVN